ncbi:mCG1034556, partial [Mus musculus]
FNFCVREFHLHEAFAPCGCLPGVYPPQFTQGWGLDPETEQCQVSTTPPEPHSQCSVPANLVKEFCLWVWKSVPRPPW